MSKKTDRGETEYPVSPEDLATVLATKASFSTGLILPNTICMISEGAVRTVVEYRPPQKTALWLEGSEDAVHVPLPGLLMVRTTTGGKRPTYAIHAVKERPVSMDAPLFQAPLPNVSTNGAVCWGTVTRVRAKALAGNSLHEDWAQLLGSPFGNHSVHGKTKTNRDDIRKFYLALEKRKARVFPAREMVPQNRTLGKALARATSPDALNDWEVDDFEDDIDDEEMDGE